MVEGEDFGAKEMLGDIHTAIVTDGVTFFTELTRFDFQWSWLRVAWYCSALSAGCRRSTAKQVEEKCDWVVPLSNYTREGPSVYLHSTGATFISSHNPRV